MPINDGWDLDTSMNRSDSINARDADYNFHFLSQNTDGFPKLSGLFFLTFYYYYYYYFSLLDPSATSSVIPHGNTLITDWKGRRSRLKLGPQASQMMNSK